MMFSDRVPSDLSHNRLSETVERSRAAGRPFLDLTDSNPTRASLSYPPDLLRPLADQRGLVYEPHPLGHRSARLAVAADYARRGFSVPVERVVLTASSSESYSLLFKILCDPGDEVLTPRPSYPLFEHLARLDGVRTRSYDLEYHGEWSIDIEGLVHQLSARTRAVLLVSPNNPTGSFVRAAEIDRIAVACAERSVALVADEVFADYELTPGAAAAGGSLLGRSDALSFSLGGLSKSIGLPQVKLGWMAVSGPASLVEATLLKLELACDTYLSVSTPVQTAAAELFEKGAAIRGQIQERTRRNLRSLADLAAGSPECRLLRAEGGWSAILHVPTLQSEEELVLELLEREHVLVHPGYFFDVPRETHIVVSLLTPPDAFDEGIRRVLRHFACRASPHRD
jgi:aspartate/methionine/tyrosine aminotransferase